MQRVIQGFVAVAIGFVAAFAAANVRAEPNPFSDLGGVTVYITSSGDAAEGGLRETEIRTEVELILRRNSVPILSRSESAPIVPTFWVKADAFYEYSTSGTRRGYFACVSTSIMELGYLARHAAISKIEPLLVTSWQEVSCPTGPPEDLRAGTLEAIRKLTKEFANAYLAANPKK